MRKIVKYCLILAIAGNSLSCGNDSKIYLYTPSTGGTNPFPDLVANQATSALYFRFMPLQDNFTSIDQVVPGQEIWYPATTGMGLSPAQTSFDLGGLELTKGKYYRIELYGKTNYQSSTWTVYGAPDCPFSWGIGNFNRVNICVAYKADYDDPNPPPVQCVGMRTFSLGQCNQ